MASGVVAAPELSALDVVRGVPLGLDLAITPLKVTRRTPRDPVKALEEALVPALERPPCLVSFSGGRDSSALLALAAKVSRERGFDLPLPATLIFPGDNEANEDEWQAIVLAELKLPDWVRIEIMPGELDAVGPVAAKGLRRHGLIWPFNTHFHSPIIERAAGGSVVTGFGGDELARASASARAERLVARQERTKPHRALAIAGLALAPFKVREAVYWRRARKERFPWLTPLGRHLVRSASARDDAAVPFGFDRKLTSYVWRSRYFRLCQESFRALGSSCDTLTFHPLVAGPVLEALAARGGFPGFGGRDDLVRLLFGGILPPAVLTRATKGAFSTPLWSSTAVAFAREWSGQGVDTDLVDADLLREHWLDPERNLLSTTLLQQAWLHDHRQGQP